VKRSHLNTNRTRAEPLAAQPGAIAFFSPYTCSVATWHLRLILCEMAAFDTASVDLFVIICHDIDCIYCSPCYIQAHDFLTRWRL
jgi:hypothetical protein